LTESQTESSGTIRRKRRKLLRDQADSRAALQCEDVAMNLPPVVSAELERCFSEAEISDARKVLPSAQELPQAPYERTLVAILSLAGGDLAALSHFSRRAREDWRDVLYWHETPRGYDESEGWTDMRKGLRLPDEGD
jgi:hypothetical protein